MSRDEPRASLPIPVSGPLEGEIQAPPSKSLTIRAMAAAALASGRSTLRGPLLSDDTFLMARGLEALGIQVSRGSSFVELEGRSGGIPSRGATLDLGDAGTPLRLLTGICCLGRGRFLLDGSPRMRQRPVADLIEAVGSLGVSIRSLNGDGCPPVEILAGGFPGGRARLRGDVSSQYLSSLLMVAPCGASDLEIEVAGNLVSRPYVDLTIQVMERFGAAVHRDGYSRFRVPAGSSYRPVDYPVEGDASSASYFFAAAAIAGGRVRVTGIPADSRQGDLRFLDLLEAMGCIVRREAGGLEVEAEPGTLHGIQADLADTPDIAPTLAAVALFTRGPTTLSRISHLRGKETDRVESVAACVRALGGGAETGPDFLTVTPPPKGPAGLRGCDIDPQGDHRLAMAFSLTGLAVPGVRITDPSCVGKSFPDFFDQLRALTA